MARSAAELARRAETKRKAFELSRSSANFRAGRTRRHEARLKALAASLVSKRSIREELKLQAKRTPGKQCRWYFCSKSENEEEHAFWEAHGGDPCGRKQKYYVGTSDDEGDRTSGAWMPEFEPDYDSEVERKRTKRSMKRWRRKERKEGMPFASYSPSLPNLSFALPV